MNAKRAYEGKDELDAMEFLKLVKEETNKFDILVELLSESGALVMDWNIKQACPIKFTGTDLKSTENAIAIETMEFSYEEILTT